MARHRNPVPSYVLHKQSGRARLLWTDHLGVRQQKLLPGPFGSPESLAAKARLELELATAPARAPAGTRLSVAEVLAAFLAFAVRHSCDQQGNPTDEVRHLKAAIRPVRELYGTVPATSFGPLALKAVRQRFVDLRWCRKTVNARVDRVRRVFKWAVAEELVPASVYQALAAVTGLQRGRTPAGERAPVRPVSDATVDATLPYLNRHVRGLVEFQRLTGCRPGEACGVRRCDIDTSGPVWLYKPAHHKGAWRGKERSIAVGPKAQEVLRGFFTPDAADYLFSPRRAVEEFRAERSANRKTPRWASHLKRNDAKRVGSKRLRAPAERYNRLGYLTAVTRACDRAFPLPPELSPVLTDTGKTESRTEWWNRLDDHQRAAAKAWRKNHHWHPNQLRHTFATRVRTLHGLEAAQVLLGHARADVTQVYAERNEELAVSLAAQIG